MSYHDANLAHILCAVELRQMSEGINFTNHRGRAVLITGIPYPSKADAKVMAKRAFLNDRCRKNANQVGSLSLSLLFDDSLYE